MSDIVEFELTNADIEVMTDTQEIAAAYQLIEIEQKEISDLEERLNQFEGRLKFFKHVSDMRAEKLSEYEAKIADMEERIFNLKGLNREYLDRIAETNKVLQALELLYTINWSDVDKLIGDM